MIEFIEGLLPPGVHVLTAQEFVQMFCFNPHRLALYSEGLRPVAKELSSKNIKDLFVDGSFVEQSKLYPNDIDAFFEISIPDFSVAFMKESFVNWHIRAKMDFNIDIFSCLLGVPGPREDGKEFQTNQEYWHYKFGHTRAMQPKGIIRLTSIDIIQTEVPRD